jgi:flagellar export protein FliJ
VPEKTRLDPVVDMRERAAEAVERELAAARREAQKREQELAAAKARAAVDQRQSGDAAEWQLVEAGHARSLQMVRTTEQQLRAQATVVEKTRVKAQSANMALEVVRRAADRKRAEAIQTRAKADAKQLDAIATLLYTAQ